MPRKTINGCENMEKDANPKTANGKRGLYSEGMNNNMNKAVRCLEDINAAHLVHGHPMFCVEGTALLEATVVYAEAVKQLTKAYNDYAALNGTGLMTQGGVKVIANATAQQLVAQVQLDVAKDVAKAREDKTKAKGKNKKA